MAAVSPYTLNSRGPHQRALRGGELVQGHRDALGNAAWQEGRQDEVLSGGVVLARFSFKLMYTDPKEQTPNTRARTQAGVRARIGSDATARAHAHAHM